MKKLQSLMGLLNLHKTPRLFLALWADRRVSWWLKTSAVCGMVYIFSPLDLMPDLTGIGLLDDIVVCMLIMQTFIELAPANVVDEHCERLGMTREQVFVSVPKTVQDALEMYQWATGKRWQSKPGQEDSKEPQPAERQEPSEPPPYTRYSAFDG